VAVKFDLFENCQEGSNSTELYTIGASPKVPATTPGGGANPHGEDPFQVHITRRHDPNAVNHACGHSSQAFTTSWPINIPPTVGGNTALVGFTRGTGGHSRNCELDLWPLTVEVPPFTSYG